MLLGTLCASLLTGRGLYRAGHGLTPFYPLTNFQIRDYFNDEPRFNGVYSRNNLLKIKKDLILLI